MAAQPKPQAAQQKPAAGKPAAKPAAQPAPANKGGKK
jgi:hypothetical protein